MKFVLQIYYKKRKKHKNDINPKMIDILGKRKILLEYEY